MHVEIVITPIQWLYSKNEGFETCKTVMRIVNECGIPNYNLFLFRHIMQQQGIKQPEEV